MRTRGVELEGVSNGGSEYAAATTLLIADTIAKYQQQIVELESCTLMLGVQTTVVMWFYHLSLENQRVAAEIQQKDQECATQADAVANDRDQRLLRAVQAKVLMQCEEQWDMADRVNACARQNDEQRQNHRAADRVTAQEKDQHAECWHKFDQEMQQQQAHRTVVQNAINRSRATESKFAGVSDSMVLRRERKARQRFFEAKYQQRRDNYFHTRGLVANSRSDEVQLVVVQGKQQQQEQCRRSQILYYQQAAMVVAHSQQQHRLAQGQAQQHQDACFAEQSQQQLTANHVMEIGEQQSKWQRQQDDQCQAFILACVMASQSMYSQQVDHQKQQSLHEHSDQAQKEQQQSVQFQQNKLSQVRVQQCAQYQAQKLSHQFSAQVANATDDQIVKQHYRSDVREAQQQFDLKQQERAQGDQSSKEARHLGQAVEKARRIKQIKQLEEGSFSQGWATLSLNGLKAWYWLSNGVYDFWQESIVGNFYAINHGLSGHIVQPVKHFFNTAIGRLMAQGLETKNTIGEPESTYRTDIVNQQKADDNVVMTAAQQLLSGRRNKARATSSGQAVASSVEQKNNSITPCCYVGFFANFPCFPAPRRYKPLEGRRTDAKDNEFSLRL